MLEHSVRLEKISIKTLATLIVQAVVKQEYPGAVVTASTSSSTPTSARRKPRNPIPVERKVAQNWLDQFPISEVLVLFVGGKIAVG